MSGSGGLLNLAAVGNNNKILLGNPSLNAFKVKYSKIRNFGKQAFRIDYDGQRDLRLTESSTFQFNIPNYAELLLDTFLCINLPDIWSPIYQPCPETGNVYSGYDFRWIDDIGLQMIEEVLVTSGSMTIARYSGSYLSNVIERDYTSEKKDLIKRASGNIPELNNPAIAFGRTNCYPSAYYTENPVGAEPSIRGRQLYIPINTWYSQDSRCAFPLIAQQYNSLTITIRLRPIQQLFRIRDIFDVANQYPYIQPDFNQQQYALYRFLQTPPSTDLSPINYVSKIQGWKADIHLIGNYVFLTNEDAKEFARDTQLYLIKDVYEYQFDNKVGASKSQLKTNGLVTNWMFYLQRNDVNLRNEWNNYTNFPYENIPVDIQLAQNLINPNGVLSGIYITGDANAANQKEILQTLSILMDGNYRENAMTSGFYNYVDKLVRSNGGGKDGLYFYNFGLNTGQYQPTGAINTSKFRNVEFEYTTLVPEVDVNGLNENIVCGNNGEIIGIFKSNYRLYSYSYNLIVQEERYNILSFQGGYCGLMYAR